MKLYGRDAVLRKIDVVAAHYRPVQAADGAEQTLIFHTYTPKTGKKYFDI